MIRLGAGNFFVQIALSYFVKIEQNGSKEYHFGAAGHFVRIGQVVQLNILFSFSSFQI
jgi:hypothetical protein